MSLFKPGTLERMQSLYPSGSILYKYDGLGIHSKCTATENNGIYTCLTAAAGIDSFPNAMLQINMGQKLMFIVMSNSPCAKAPRIIGLYGPSKLATLRQIPLDQFDTSFKSYAQDYSRVMGCPSATSSYTYDEDPFGFNMRWMMPWETDNPNASPLQKI